nr:hypothetical protein [Tanacetum cinerariifolium]
SSVYFRSTTLPSSFPLPAPGLHVPPTVIEYLSTRLGNLEYRHRVLMRKMEEVSVAEVADSIAIGEIHPRVATIEEQVQVMESQAVQVVSRLKEIKTRVEQVESRVTLIRVEDDVEWIMAPVTPPRATVTVSSTYEVGGPSTAAIEGSSFPLPAPGLHVPPTVIEYLSTRLGNLEYRHRVLMRKMEEVSVAEVADSIAIGEIHPIVATIEEQVQVMESQAVQVLRTRVAEMESHVGILMSYMLWMEERLSVLEKRLPGPPLGPQ